MDQSREKRDAGADDGKESYPWPPPDEVLQKIVSVDLATGELAPLKVDVPGDRARGAPETPVAKPPETDSRNDLSLFEVSRRPPGGGLNTAVKGAGAQSQPGLRPAPAKAERLRATAPLPRPERRVNLTRMHWLVAALAVLALGEGAFIAWQMFGRRTEGAAAANAPVSETASPASTHARSGTPEPLPPTDSRGTTGQSSSVAIRSNPSGARVWIDGRPRGQTPLTVGQLSPGQHELILQGATGRVQQRIDLEAGVKSTIVATLADTGVGGITVNAPAELQIMERGRLVGSTRTEKILLNPGRHTLDLVNEALGYQSRQVVDVATGKTTVIAPTLPNGTLSVNALPWAEVLLDGQPIGQTPLGNLPVRIGPHEITFRHPELGEVTRTVMVTLRGPARVSVDLQKQER